MTVKEKGTDFFKIYDKEIVFRVYKELLQFINKTDILIKIAQTSWIDTSLRKKNRLGF